VPVDRGAYGPQRQGLGDAPGGVKPGLDGHDEAAVAQLRLAELRESAKILGVTELETLGYHDSGMPDWDYKDRPDAFCNIPEADVAARISGLIDRYRPQVLITYDDQGAYQHPDHVHASRSAQKAFAASGSVAKLYLTAMRGSDWRKIWAALRELGADVPDFENPDPERQRRGLESEQRITTTVDIRQVLPRKREALFAHGSMLTNILAGLYYEWSAAARAATPTLYDPMTLASLLDPSLCPLTPMHIRVDDAGNTLAEAGSPNAQVCLHSDADAFLRFYVNRVAGR